MSAGRPIVVFSSIDWDYMWQGHQEVTSRLAAAGHPVLFVENTGLRRPRLIDLTRIWRRARRLISAAPTSRDPVPGLRIHAPVILPFPYAAPAVRLNHSILEGPISQWLKGWHEAPIVWTYLPTPLVRSLTKQMSPALVVYYCVDDLPASSSLASRVAGSEAALIRSADLVFVTSEKLREKALKYRTDVHLFPAGVDYGRFAAVRDGGEPLPPDIAALPRPVAGYVGALHRWFDVTLAAAVARRLPQVQFVFIGAADDRSELLRGLPNVHLLGARLHHEIPDYVHGFDVGLIPYVLDAYTESVFPTKLNEYLAMGLPVVATPIREIEAFRQRHGAVLATARDAEGFAAAVNEALTTKASQAVIDSRFALAQSQDWGVRVDAMRTLMEAALERKGSRGSR